jgi:hypothetical protein
VTTPEEPRPQGARRLGDAAARLREDTAELVRQELREVRDELADTMRRAGVGGAALAGAGALGLLAAVAAHQTALRALESVLPRPAAAAVLGLGYAAGAAGLAVYGAERLRAAAQSSGEAIDKVREDLPDGAGPANG